MEGGDGGQVIVPEEADESRLLQMVEGFLEPLMPQDGALLEEEIDILRFSSRANSAFARVVFPAPEGDERTNINPRRA